MRCLFVADLHYALPQFDWLLKTAPGYDLTVLAGDALDLASIVDYRAQTLVVRKYLQRLAGVTRLLVCSGNHDIDSRGAGGEKVARWLAETGAPNIVRDGDSLAVEDMLFTVCPWWDGPTARAALAAQLEADFPAAARIALGLDLSCAAGQFTDELVGQPVNGGRRP